jgi:peptidoglycan/xylan/chitin deacetylase (PgdA/CDA1 family)
MGVWRGGRRVADTGGVVAEPAGNRRLSRRRWAVAVAVTFVLLNVLVVGAYANSRFVPDNRDVGNVEVAGDAAVPADVREGGTVVDATGTRVASHRMPARTIALTFDDGPDPVWTPRIIEVLARHHVAATFFVVGAQVSRHPDLVRELASRGHELGIHTFTHPNLAELSSWRRRLEYAQTQEAVAYAAGVTTPLLRLPYSSGVDALDGASWSVAQEAGRWGYLVVFNDTDSRDWARPGAATIVRSSTPQDGRGQSC